MIALTKSAFALLKEKSVSLWVYAILLLTSLGIAGISSDYFANGESLPDAYYVGLSIPILALNMVAFWFFIRQLGKSNQPGSVVGWIAWTLPIIPIYAVIYGIWFAVPITAEELPWTAYWAVESLVVSLSLALGFPFILLSVARALDIFGPSAISILSRGRKFFPAFFSLTFVSYFSGYFLYEAFTTYFGAVADGGLEAFFVASIGGIFEFLAMIFVTAICIVIFREAERLISEDAASL